MQAWKKGAWSVGSWAGTVWADDIIIGGGPHDWTWEYHRKEQETRKKEEEERKHRELIAQETIAAESERITHEEWEQRERKEQLAINKARLILAREASERDEIQQDIDRLQVQIASFIQNQIEQERLEAQEREIVDIMMIFMMEA